MPFFDFDPPKALANLRKHGVSFDEAVSVFEGDPSAYIDFDPDHSDDEERFFTIGISARGRMLYIMRRMAQFVSSTPEKPNRPNGNSMKPQTAKTTTTVTKSRTAVRGKYFNQLPEGTNLATIDPALHKHFPDSESVNRALQAIRAIREQIIASSASALAVSRKAA